MASSTSASSTSHRPLWWTRLLSSLPDGYSPIPDVLTSLISLLAPSIATMGMGGAVSSSSDLTSLQYQHQHQHQQNNNNASSSTGPGHCIIFGSTLKSCAVCLEDYRPGDRLRLLDPCGHCFHSKCIDQWFDSPSSCSLSYLPCPVCKTPVVIYSLPPKPVTRNSNSSSQQNDDDTNTHYQQQQQQQQQQPWAHIQLIDLSVHQTWVEWFSDIWKVHEFGNSSTSRRRI